MMGTQTRRSRWALVGVILLVGLGRGPVQAVDEPKPRPEPKDKAQAEKKAPAEKKAQAEKKAPADESSDWREDLKAFFRRPGEDPPRPSVPLRPATVEDRRRIEATRLYTAARALEDRGLWTDAVALLQEAAKLDPDSVAIARRLGRIYIGALGRPDLAIKYNRRVLANDPDDTETLARLVDFYSKRGEPETAVEVLKEELDNPKLAPHAPGRLIAEYELGRLYYTRLKNLEKAADAFAKVVEELDNKAANRLSPVEQNRILGNDPSNAYLNFGMIFLAARRDDLVIKALERGLVYDEGNPQIALLLAEALLRQNKPARALELVDRTIRRQPQGVEAYDLLAKVLKAMGRENEITPRLEEAARRDSKNVPLQYVLADRYRETGQVDKAEKKYRDLLKSQPTPQTYRALAASLLKREKIGDLLKVFCEAWTRPMARAAVMQQARAVAEDESATLAMLDRGIEMLSAKPPALPSVAFRVLADIGGYDHAVANRPDRLERMLKLHRLQIEQDPSAIAYRELADTLVRSGQHKDAIAIYREMFEKYPDEKSAINLLLLANAQRRDRQIDKAKATLDEVRKSGPNDPRVQQMLAGQLADVGQVDDALDILAGMARREPNASIYDILRAEILGRFGRNEEAIKIYEDVLKRFGGDEEAVRYARQGLSVVYVNMGNYTKGEAELKTLLEKNPDDDLPNNDLGYLYAEQGKNLEQAEEMIRKALNEKPENAAYLDSMGWVLFKRGKLKEALETMKKAAERMQAERSEPDSTILEHLGDVYLKLQDVEKAEESWQKALNVAEKSIPPEKRVDEIRKKLDSLRKAAPRARGSANPSP